MSPSVPAPPETKRRFQATTLGLGSEWERVKTAYAAANRALGDIVKAGNCCLWEDVVFAGSAGNARCSTVGKGAKAHARTWCS